MLTTWLLLCTFTDPGLALTWLNIVHALCTFPAFHVFKIQRFDKQNIYDGEAEPQTYWEQIDNGKQWTKTRKVRTARPPTRGDGITPPEVEIPPNPAPPPQLTPSRKGAPGGPRGLVPSGHELYGL